LNANGRKAKEPEEEGGGALDAVKRSNEMSLNPMEFYSCELLMMGIVVPETC